MAGPVAPEIAPTIGDLAYIRPKTASSFKKAKIRSVPVSRQCAHVRCMCVCMQAKRKYKAGFKLHAAQLIVYICFAFVFTLLLCTVS